MRIAPFVLSVAIAFAAFGAARAQHQHGHDHAAQAAASPVEDRREFVKFPTPLVEHTLANMRDHLHALQEIQDHLGQGHFDVAARIAEARLGMSSLGLHGAQNVAPYMPQGMQDAGTAMHKAASRFAVAATNAGVSGDYKAAFAGLAQVTATCVACHAGYRIK
ncbi:MAG: cytochrome c [Rhodoblastus sp.]|nr:cytochrome c [Rhodoblastus sp.]